MLLYRCVPLGEILNKMEKREVITGDNTFIYQENTEYRHFFRFSKDAEYYFRRSFVPSKNMDYHWCFMILEIDEEKVKPYMGYGKYNISKISLNPNETK